MSTEITAKLRFLRIGPRKVRLITDLIRGRRALKAVETLSLLNKRAARPVLKLLKSAMANAKHNNSLEPENLRVAKITVDGGPVLKRWMPKAHGRATPVRERTSHINLVLINEEPKVKKESAAVKAVAGKEKAKKEKDKKEKTK
jgi:large subunit ribosomal protein L22